MRSGLTSPLEVDAPESDFFDAAEPELAAVEPLADEVAAEAELAAAETVAALADAAELLESRELMAAEQAALTSKARTVTMAHRTMPATAIPLPLFLPFLIPEYPAMDKTRPMMPKTGEPKLINGHEYRNQRDYAEHHTRYR